MRKVTKSYDKPPGELGATIKHNKRLLKFSNGTGNPDTKNIYHSIYGAEPVRKKLANLYFNKCAYCETKDPEFQIEHYRPKRSVHDLGTHPGYYWLSYEWSNLIPACHHCNSSRSKSTKFPIDGTRVISPRIINGKYSFPDHNLQSRRLMREYPLLINPEEPNFDPEKYFRFDSLGRMLPKSNDINSRPYRRAKATIEDIVRLNRDGLYLNERRKDLRDYEKRLLAMFMFYFRDFRLHGPAAANDVLRRSFYEVMSEIKSKAKPENEFSFFWSYVYQNFYMYLPKRLKKRPKDRVKFRKLISSHS